MTYTATFTSKRQLTIPIKLFEKIGFNKGDRVSVSEKDGSLILTPATELVKKLAGSLKVPRKYRGLSEAKLVSQAKSEYFIKRHKQ
jgi:bifunctional DNA-binding transcriptional regulator/antitoxin component of YhaV-PrlF toxin-antitoxin module